MTALLSILVDNIETAAAAVTSLTRLSRANVRARFEERFAIERVAEDYLALYHALSGVRSVTRRIPAPQRRLMLAAAAKYEADFGSRREAAWVHRAAPAE